MIAWTTPAQTGKTSAKNVIQALGSPDSRSLGFYADLKLKKIDIAGGPAVTLSDVSSALGAAWGGNDVIVFSGGQGQGCCASMRGAALRPRRRSSGRMRASTAGRSFCRTAAIFCIESGLRPWRGPGPSLSPLSIRTSGSR